ncbi:hypothetical protein FOZ63_022025 [Perkinsus olseni]|uniref:EF-hand domain-containing protein n=1 Tax=Perkinsus olseni TaxID=32597 RepID=A0A7J6NFA0_PEROL|nr:hypothetical protein FOZ63_022025 [Perkinsus olseni]
MVLRYLFGAVSTHSDEEEKSDNDGSGTITIDEAIEAADGFGRYQKRVTATMGMAWVIFGAVMISTVFTTMSPDADANFTSPPSGTVSCGQHRSLGRWLAHPFGASSPIA